VQTRYAGNCCDHHAGEKLHGCDIAFVEGARGRRKHFEHAEGAAIVAEGRNQNRTDSEAAAAGEIHAGIALGIVAQHDFAGANGLGGNAGVGLEADTEIGSGASSAGAANNFVPSAESDGGSGGTGEMLGALGDGADRRFKIQFGGVEMNFFSDMHGAKTRDGMRGIRDAKLAAQSGGGHASIMIGNVQCLRIGDGMEQVANEAVEFRIGDEVGGLLLPQRAAENAGEAEQRLISASQAIGPAVIADQLALNAEGSRLERNEIKFFEGRAVHRLTKHECVSSPTPKRRLG
jgi:hypothetical protein